MDDTQLLNKVVDILIHEPNGTELGFGGATQKEAEARIDLKDGRIIYILIIPKEPRWPHW